MKNTLLKIAFAISFLYLSLNCNGQSSGLGITLNSPVDGQGAGTAANLTVGVVNNNASVLNTVRLTCEINGATFGSKSYTPNLIPNDSTSLIFLNQAIWSFGTYDICIYVDSTNGIATYDTTCFSIVCSSVNSLNYVEDFEGSNAGWYQTPSPIGNTEWQIGTPNYGLTNSTHSGSNAWDINLNTGYDFNATAILTSPFFDFMSAMNPKLSFWQNRNVEPNNDGFHMDYSANGGPWAILGSLNDTLGTNWYNKSIASSGGFPGWDSTSIGWEKSKYDLIQFANIGLMQFRYVFTSDNANNLDGVSIDDFSIVTCGQNVTPFVINNITCNGSCDGALSCNVTGGAPPYQYIWSIGTTTQAISSLCAGTYTILIIDANGCSSTSTISLNQTPPITITPYEAFNCLTSSDSVYIIPSGGFAPYVYNWSNGTTAFYLSNPTPGIYTVTVVDANGCSASASVTVTGSLNLSITKVDPVCYGYPSSISAAMNGVPPLTYFWSNGVTVPQLINPPAGPYTVTVTDVNGCSLSATDSLVEPDQIILTLDSVIPAGCGASNGSFNYSFTPGSFSIPWVNGVQFAPTTNLPKGIYNIYIIQNVCASNTVTVVVPDSCEDVWPGDANNDLVADNNDLLQIGLAYGKTGPVRPSATNTWVGQPATDWSNWFNIGVNQKHADCDGNGVVDAADTIPVLANYGLTHVLKPILIPQINTLAPDLFLTITQDTTGLSDTVFVSVMCGTAANPIDSIYGLAFRLYYDSALVDTGSVSFDISNSFMGTNGVNLISINKNFGAGFADFAITRTDHTNASGHGQVTVMGIVTTDNVAGKMVNPINTVLRFSIGNVHALTANENELTLDVFGDSIFVDSNLTGINYLNWDAGVKVFPNPANNYFTVASALTNIIKIELLNQLGETVYENEKPRMPQHINVSTIPNGVYVLRIETKNGVMHKKMQVIK